MSWRHRDILEAELHEPKGFTTANNGDSIWRNEKGTSEWTDREVLPAALNFVDASVAPPTTATGDIYVLSLGASIHANWGTVALKDWVRYDGTSWQVITPSKSIICYDKTLDVLMSYDGSVWNAVGGGDNIANANLIQSDLDRTYTMPNLGKLAFGGLNSEFHLEDAIDFRMFNGSNDTASNERFRVFVGANTSYLYFNNSRTSMTTVSDDLTLRGHATTIHTSQLQLGADIDITTSNTRSVRFRTANIFFQDITGVTNYGHIDDDEFYWGGINPIGNEKFSIQVDTLVKGSDTSESSRGFCVTDVSNDMIFDVRNNGQVGYGGDYNFLYAHKFRNPNNEARIASFDNGVSGVESFIVEQNGIISTEKNGVTIFKTATIGNISYIQLKSNNSEVVKLANNNSFILSKTAIGGNSNTTGSIFEIKQTSTNTYQQLFFANARMTTTGRVNSSGSFGATQAGFECYDTTLNKKFIWNGSAWEQITSV